MAWATILGKTKSTVVGTVRLPLDGKVMGNSRISGGLASTCLFIVLEGTVILLALSAPILVPRLLPPAPAVLPTLTILLEAQRVRLSIPYAVRLMELCKVCRLQSLNNDLGD